MSISDILLQNYMPRNILDNEDDADAWSLGGSSGSSSQSSEPGLPLGTDIRDTSDFRLFQDYFGLSNLLNNVKISDDNPLLYAQKNLSRLHRVRKLSWGSDGSDSAAVLSPTIDNSQYSFDRNFDLNNNDNFKQLPPPSTRLTKAMREHIISGAYQQSILENRHTDKFVQTPPATPVLPPSPPRPQPPPALNNVMNNMPNAPALPRPQNAVQVCVFCRNNGESESVYTSHVLKDADGRTACPILRAYTCPICKANGDNSHTIKYCPMNQNARGQSGPLPPPGMMAPQQQMNLRNQQPRPMGNFRPPFPTGNLPHNNQRLNHPGKIR